MMAGERLQQSTPSGTDAEGGYRRSSGGRGSRMKKDVLVAGQLVAETGCGRLQVVRP
jgi:hypothetical protein